MLIRYHYYKLLIVCNFALCIIEFDTSIGTCHLYDLPSSTHTYSIQKHIESRANQLITDFGDTPEKKVFEIHIINKNEWKNKFSNLDWATGLAKGNKIFINNGKISNNVELLKTITHEICHIYQYRIKNSNSIPSWFKEGMAMYFANEFSANTYNLISRSIWLNSLLELHDLDNISKLDKEKINLAYQESLLAYKQIIHKFGKKSINDIIYIMNHENLPFNLAFKKINDIDLIDFESNFDLQLASPKNKLIIFTEPMSWFFFSTIGLIFIFIFIKFRNRKIIKKWEIEEEKEKLNEDTFNMHDD